jgi:hypothetical protein
MDAVVSNTTVANGNDFDCRALGSLRTSGSILVESGGEALFMAPAVSLGPGFRVQAGGWLKGIGATAVDIAP